MENRSDPIILFVYLRALAAVGLVAMGVAGGAAQEQSPPLHWWMSVSEDVDAVPSAAQQIYDALTESLRELASEPGYPRPCSVRRRLAPADYVVVTCADDEDARDGIRLTSDGRFLHLEVVDSPDARLYLFEVTLLTDGDDPAVMRPQDRFSRTRIVIPHFSMPADQALRTLRAVARGLESSGAKAW